MFNQKELARRWRMSPRTLERWRWLREGPSYLKIGGKIIYKLTEVEAFEAARVHAPALVKNGQDEGSGQTRAVRHFC